jgi:hypothetical protein
MPPPPLAVDVVRMCSPAAHAACVHQLAQQLILLPCPLALADGGVLHQQTQQARRSETYCATCAACALELEALHTPREFSQLAYLPVILHTCVCSL